MIGRASLLAIAVGVLSGCQLAGLSAEMAPIPTAVMEQIEAVGSTPASPIFVRIFKEEAEFEVWKRRADGTYALLDTFGICAWSGVLGPKLAEGDRQAPEGFYTVGQAQMNPNSDYHLSFNIGFPNSFDQALGRTGSHLMVHGACSSAGCYSMTDEVVEIVYALAREAFRGGQRAFNVHAFPFRLTPENFARHWGNPNIPFWLMLKEGYDHFEVTHRVPDVQVCDLRYVFDADAGGAEFAPTVACPSYQIPDNISQPLIAKQEADDAAFQMVMARLEADAGAQARAARGDGPVSLLTVAFVPEPIVADPVAAVVVDDGAKTIFDRFFNRGE